MNDLKDTPTADLIAELTELEKDAKIKPVSLECVYARREKANRHSDICYELYRRRDNEGIDGSGIEAWLLLKEGGKG